MNWWWLHNIQHKAKPQRETQSMGYHQMTGSGKDLGKQLNFIQFFLKKLVYSSSN